MRRDRLERIAMAERDRRAGRSDVAVASLGEATEWPARVILALARLAEGEASETRRILEEGLDVWAEEVGLDSLDSDEAVEQMIEEAGLDAFESPAAMTRDSQSGAESDLDRPIDNNELERAFEEAEAQVDEMHDVNQVAERVLMGESVGLASLCGDDLVPNHDRIDLSADSDPEHFGMDAAVVPDAIPTSTPSGSGFASATISTPSSEIGAECSGQAAFESGDAVGSPQASREKVLATLARWLENLESSSARRTQ